MTEAGKSRHILTGTSRFYAIIGHPIAQVRSPTIFNGYIAEHDYDGAMIAMDILPGAMDSFFAMLRGWENCGGVGVTVPHKQAALANCDEASDRAKRIGACNLVQRMPDGRLVGDMTDGLGFLSALGKHGVSVKARNFVLIGAGGAGSAIAHAVADNGARRLAVLDLDGGRRDALLSSLRKHYPGVDVTGEAGDPAAIDILANATPMGMKADDPLPFPLDGIRSTTMVADAVTKPPMTKFLEQAKARGCPIQQGNEMADAQQPIFLERLGVAAPGTLTA
jgi:shikimate dehydrogenase